MLDVVLTMLALAAGGLVLELYAAARAPLGYQDDSGFHFGVPLRQGPDLSVLSTSRPRGSHVTAVVLGDAQLQPAGHA
jgi:hypothetical protein